MKIQVVDLFCGIGGLSHGLLRAGLDVKLGIDIDYNNAYPYISNNGGDFLCQSVSSLNGNDISKYYEEDSFKVLVGCAPCQNYSSYNRNRCNIDNRVTLLDHFTRLIEEVMPDYVAMENVPWLRDRPEFKRLLDKLTSLGFDFEYQVISSSSFGVPQSRRRLILMACKDGNLLFPQETHPNPEGFVTVRETIGDLRKLNAGESDPNDAMHVSRNLSDVNLQRIRHSVPGGSWKDWPEYLTLKCHRDTNKYLSVYGRMEWDKISPTITTQFIGYGNGRFGHPEQDRALTLREGALLQTFPKDYEFYSSGTEKISLKQISRAIGNAVPVKLGEEIGNSLIKMAQGRQERKNEQKKL